MPMELKMLEEKKNRIVFDLIGADHSLVGALKTELWQDSNTKAAGYQVEHPLVGMPRFVLETSGEDAKKVLRSAIKRLQKTIDGLQEQTKEIK